ncbi:MAG: hypothetical protein HQK56_03075 [Deltaproteobacteria bacterium]|nr:hypothetical protein [Deltaproteobacteria bacterium]
MTKDRTTPEGFDLEAMEKDIENAIDRLFVPVGGIDLEAELVSDKKPDFDSTASGRMAKVKEYGKPDSKTGRPESQLGAAAEVSPSPLSLEEQIDRAIDTLFIPAQLTPPQPPEPSEAQPIAPPKIVAAASPGTDGSQVTPAKKTRPKAISLEELKACLLSLEWEISPENISKSLTQARLLKDPLSARQDIFNVLKMIINVLSFLKATGAETPVSAIQFLRSALQELETLTREKISDEEIIKRVNKLSRQFRKVKLEADQIQKRRAAMPEPSQVKPAGPAKVTPEARPQVIPRQAAAGLEVAVGEIAEELPSLQLDVQEKDFDQTPFDMPTPSRPAFQESTEPPAEMPMGLEMVFDEGEPQASFPEPKTDTDSGMEPFDFLQELESELPPPQLLPMADEVPIPPEEPVSLVNVTLILEQSPLIAQQPGPPPEPELPSPSAVIDPMPFEEPPAFGVAPPEPTVVEMRLEEEISPEIIRPVTPVVQELLIQKESPPVKPARRKEVKPSEPPILGAGGAMPATHITSDSIEDVVISLQAGFQQLEKNIGRLEPLKEKLGAAPQLRKLYSYLEKTQTEIASAIYLVGELIERLPKAVFAMQAGTQVCASVPAATPVAGVVPADIPDQDRLLSLGRYVYSLYDPIKAMAEYLDRVKEDLPLDNSGFSFPPPLFDSKLSDDPLSPGYQGHDDVTETDKRLGPPYSSESSLDFILEGEENRPSDLDGGQVAEKSVAKEPTGFPAEVRLAALGTGIFALPAESFIREMKISPGKAKTLSARDYIMLKDIKPLFGNLNKDFIGPIAEMSKAELKDLVIPRVIIPEGLIADFDPNDMTRVNGIVFLMHEGQYRALFIWQEPDSMRYKVISGEFATVNQIISGKVKLDNNEEVPLIDVKKIFSLE